MRSPRGPAGSSMALALRPIAIHRGKPLRRFHRLPLFSIMLALMAVQTQTTEVLDTFPTIPVVQEAEQILAEAENPEVTIPQET